MLHFGMPRITHLCVMPLVVHLCGFLVEIVPLLNYSIDTSTQNRPCKSLVKLCKTKMIDCCVMGTHIVSYIVSFESTSVLWWQKCNSTSEWMINQHEKATAAQQKASMTLLIYLQHTEILILEMGEPRKECKANTAESPEIRFRAKILRECITWQLTIEPLQIKDKTWACTNNILEHIGGVSLAKRVDGLAFQASLVTCCYSDGVCLNSLEWLSCRALWDNLWQQKCQPSPLSIIGSSQAGRHGKKRLRTNREWYQRHGTFTTMATDATSASSSTNVTVTASATASTHSLQQEATLHVAKQSIAGGCFHDAERTTWSVSRWW